MGNNDTDRENSGQDVVILTETDQELRLNQHAEEVELKAQQVVESFPFYLSSSEEYLVDFQPTLSDTTESYPSGSSAVELLQQPDATANPTEKSFDSQHRAALEKGIGKTTDVHDSPQNTSLQPSVYNKTDSHHIFNLTVSESDTERSAKLVKSAFTSVEHTHLKDQQTNDSQEIETSRLNVSPEQDNEENEGDPEKSLWEVSLAPKVTAKLEETTVKAPVQMFPSTQASVEDAEMITQAAQTTESSKRNQLAPLDGSGDASQGTPHVKYTNQYA